MNNTTLDLEDRVYAPGSSEPAPCMWFARCDKPANGLRDGGPLGMTPICARCAAKIDSLRS